MPKKTASPKPQKQPRPLTGLRPDHELRVTRASLREHVDGARPILGMVLSAAPPEVATIVEALMDELLRANTLTVMADGRARVRLIVTES